jgi:hypothetical protein
MENEMGWDGYATNITPEAKAAFKAAATRVVEEVGSVDGMLKDGGLDCAPCARALQDFAGFPAWTDVEPARVAKYWKPETWPPNVEIDMNPAGDAWAILSAREFLRVCAEYGLGYEASY